MPRPGRYRSTSRTGWSAWRQELRAQLRLLGWILLVGPWVGAALGVLAGPAGDVPDAPAAAAFGALSLAGAIVLLLTRRR
jgi:hypothetical protein